MTNQVLTVASQTNSDSIANTAMLAFSTDAGTPTAETFNIGFVPRYISLWQLTGAGAPTQWEWQEGMAATNVLKSVGSTGITTLDTADGPVVPGAVTDISSSPGTVTWPAAVMIASATYVMQAIG